MRNYNRNRSHHRNPYSHRWFALEIADVCRQFREGQYSASSELEEKKNYFKNLKALKKVIRDHLDEIGLHTTARERNQLLERMEPLLSNPRSEHGAYVKGAVSGIFDIILAEGIHSRNEL